ncbi:MAG: enoyl-CoA hydratase/isomerase family protein [Acidimicrobiia bacterium]
MIRWEVRGAVGLATLDRPERRNALSVEMCHQLRGHLAEHRALRAVVLTGAGSAFCAGADLGHPLATSSGDTPGPGGAGDTPNPGGEDEFRPAFEPLLDAVVDYPAPVIAAVNGPALGGGTQLVVACDLRVAGPDAAFGIPAAQLGVMLAPENIQRLAHLVGQAHARDILLTGRRIGGEEALRMGLVQRQEPDALAGALALAEEISALAPLSVAGHKAALNALARHTGWSRGEDDALLAEIDRLVARAFASEDLKEGLAAFAEKRRPGFAGR